MLLARVAVPVPLGQAFSYRVPRDLAGEVLRGVRVLVEFGRRKVLGVVIDVGEGEPDFEAAKLKSIAGVVGPEPIVEKELLDFLLELARYYLAPVGEVIRLALPAVERSSVEQLKQAGLLEAVDVRTVGRLVQYVERVEGVAAPEGLRGQAQAIFERLSLGASLRLGELETDFKSARTAVKRLAKLGLVRIERREQQSDFTLQYDEQAASARPTLNEAQARAVTAIVDATHAGDRVAFLLDGVTASGKTEVYLHAAEACLEQGQGVIVLVPEIALTPQLAARFRSRLGDEVAVLHSALGDKERLSMWRKLRSGEFKVAVGARSALFAPVRELRLICVDEEHDGSFKQEEGVRYDARDMALLRAHRAGAVAVLGSATPSLKSEVAVKQGKMQRLKLPARAHAKAVMPRIEVVDLRRVGPGPSGDRLLSLPLHRALERCLEAKEQAILFLNRRGFAPSIVCESCGEVLECQNCSVALTLHRSRGAELKCHYCDHVALPPNRCPRCGAGQLAEEGAGTERIQTLLAEAFPEARVARLDRDVAPGAKSERILSKMRRGEIDILVGTQMVTKGHDLPDVTLVGVLNADAALSLPDFRASERCFQLLVQVAGRAGRSERPGTVIIQTRRPEHPAVLHAVRHDVGAFTQSEIKERRELGYPPFSRIALVRFDAVVPGDARREAQRLAALARAASEGVQVLGPAEAPLARLRNRYRYRFMLRASERPPLRAALLAVLRSKVHHKVRMSVDVDPVNML